ncbi:MAG: SprT family zinc-dependent metalloprotease [Candidatus Omnitrophota bacterium]
MRAVKINKILFSKRNTLSIEISHDASLIVRAPKQTPLKLIKEFVDKKRFWIEDKQKIARKKYCEAAPKKFVNGEGFLYLGKVYRLLIANNGHSPLYFNQEFQLRDNCRNNARRLFTNWYKNQAYQIIYQKVNYFGLLYGFKHNQVGITSAKKRWGSCNLKGDLHFSWRLIMAPSNIIDYVVVHELIHLEEKNHSGNFWNKVKKIIPGYQKPQKWLKDNGHLLTI